tara:strand:+ start:1312 stop:3630 length:2319 start_codon:yes stop_codon:yes gene_type:complete
MPKKLFPVNKFEGGVNSKSDPRDIGENQFVDVDNFLVNDVGKLTASESYTSESNFTSPASAAVTETIGTGSFAFKTDYAIRLMKAGTQSAINVDDGDADNSNEEGVKSYFVVNDAFSREIKLYGDVQDGSNEWSADAKFKFTEHTSGAADSAASDDLNAVEAVYYYADGALRVADANTTNTNNTKNIPMWIGHVKKTKLGVGINHWVKETNSLHIHGSTDSQFLTGSAPTYTDTSIYPSVGTFKLYANPSTGSNEGKWSKGTYEFAVTKVYEGRQESIPTIYATSAGVPYTISLGFQQYPYVQALFRRTSSSDLGWSERVQGGRIYTRKQGSNRRWRLICDIDFERGSRSSFLKDFVAFKTTSTEYYRLGVEEGTAEMQLKRPPLDTFESINGFRQDQASIDFGKTKCGYKTAVIANRRAFIANVHSRNDNDTDSMAYGDRIYFSLPNKFDTFTSDNWIDLGMNDGDEFVKIIAHNDLLFAFKKAKLYIINIKNPNDAGWILEETYDYMGVKNSGAVFKSELGVIWANENGLYIFTKQITPLSGNILDSTWSSFAGGDNVIVGYDPKDKKIITVKNSADSSAGEMYIYDVRTKSFTRGDWLIPATPNRVSNFVVHNDELHFYSRASGSAVYYLSKLNQSQSTIATKQSIITKDYDFAQPALKKRIYALYITYRFKNGTSNNRISVRRELDGAAVPSETSLSFSKSDALAGSDGWNILKLSPSSPIECETISFRIATSSNAAHPVDNSNDDLALFLEINDISVEFRPKRKRAT